MGAHWPFQVRLRRPASTEPAIVADVDGDLRYREEDADHWEALTDDDLQDYLQQRGQPTLTLLSDTPLDRADFTGSPPEDRDSDPDGEVP
ncbi:hypothetical protein [Natrialba sp. SSL1]|uniref:hypothetical protein n=1 Tax=Natrialba sp. SSL1 TaxID=1869245 RepID=UPI0008F81A30|nr:hypothetical protein [Natrialba sp. SSL1]OIB55739.1 hypothetical protein BBD46_02995 [Natrialba sp. SSL1]